MADSASVDVVIIGGGPAGLNAALVLGRSRRSVIVVDEERPSNRVTRASHNFLTRDGIAPAELRAIARKEILTYPSVQFLHGRVTAVTGGDGAFQIELADGTTMQSRKLLFATGLKLTPPAIKGMDEVFGKSAFTCPYCDGWELRDQPLVATASAERAIFVASLLRGWSANITLCTNGATLSAEQRAELAQHGVPLYEAAIEQVESEAGIVHTIHLIDGTSIPCRGIFFEPTLEAGSTILAQLGLEVGPLQNAKVDDQGMSSIPGLYIAGDASRALGKLVAAAGDGAKTAIVINNQLLQEEWARGTERLGV